MTNEELIHRLTLIRKRLEMWNEYRPKSKSEAYTKQVSIDELNKELLQLNKQLAV